MENQKSKKGLIAFLIVIIILLATALGLLLGGVIKNPFVKETNSTSTNKTTSTTKSSEKNDNTTVDATTDNYYIKVDWDKINEDSSVKTFYLGELTIDGKKYKVKYELIENTARTYLYFNDIKLDMEWVEYIAVMDGKYLLISQGGTSRGGIVDLYDSNFKKIEEEIGDSKSFVRGSGDFMTRGEYNTYIINNKTAMLYKCEDDNGYDSEENMTLIQKAMVFENGKYSIKDVMTIKNVRCMQRK